MNTCKRGYAIPKNVRFCMQMEGVTQVCFIGDSPSAWQKDPALDEI